MMVESDLSNQEELIASLDPEPVFDYLVQHGVMDQATVDEIRGQEVRMHRNQALLRHLTQEGTGSSTIALFINALRQSGQHHLASSLDVEHRIKPVYGQGYWEKQRYKGQVTIMFKVVAAKVLVRKDSEEDKTAYITDQDVMMTPHKLKRSYDNMILLPTEEGDAPRARKILDYSYEEDEDKDEKPSGWCRCFPFLCCSSRRRREKKKEKQLQQLQVVNNAGVETGAADAVKPQASLTAHCDISLSLPEQPSSPLNRGSTYFKSRPSSPSKVENSDSQTFSRKSDSLDRNSNHQLSELLTGDFSNIPDTLQTEVKYDTKSGEVTVTTQPDKTKKKKKEKGSNKKTKKEWEMVQANNHKNEPGKGPGESDKENGDPCIYAIEKNGQVKSGSPNKGGNVDKTRSQSAMKRSETYELVERWKSEGAQFEHAKEQFCTFLDSAIQGRIVRYFEQKRRTLLLQVQVEEELSVSTICMTVKQVTQLRDDYERGLIHEDLVQLMMPQDFVDKMDCCAVHLRTVIDMNDFTQALQEVS